MPTALSLGVNFSKYILPGQELRIRFASDFSTVWVCREVQSEGKLEILEDGGWNPGGTALGDSQE